MTAASNLLGLSLEGGWKVTKHIAKSPSATGGVFSESYEVRNRRRVGFLKAFDFSRAFELGVDTTKVIEELVQDFNHERDVLAHCGERRLSNVVVAIDHGSVQVPQLSQMEGRVFYMIFEMATGDVRVQMDTQKRNDSLWCLQVLKDACLGLHQVHKEMIAHQDMKPSNVLSYDNRKFKISDFGRSSRRGHAARHDSFSIAGDRSYAPPELIYGHLHSDFMPRRMGCDLYMLGNLSAFMFSGVNITAHLISKIDPQHHPANWNGTYAEVLPYVQNAFAGVLAELGPLIDEYARGGLLTLIAELCEPDPSRRGDKRGVGGRAQYSLERYVSRFDLLARRLVITLNSRRAA